MATVTIEKTSKKLKGQLVLCRLGYIAAIIWGMCSFANADINVGELNLAGPIILFVCSLIWAIVTRFRIWWNHG